jgi:hypothetical protein
MLRDLFGLGLAMRGLSSLVLCGAALLLFSVAAVAGIGDGALCTKNDPCNSRGIFTEKSAGPTKGDGIRVNPAVVPVESVTGIEAIYYRGAFDFALVKGLGRIGAALSPSNSDETFFGPPADEDPTEFYERLVALDKYEAHKYTLAGAVNLISKEGEGFRHINVNVGVLGRYITATKDILPGAGLQVIAGPLYVGGAISNDETQVTYVTGATPLNLNNQVTSISGGLSLDSVLLDYSTLTVSGDSTAKATVITVTGFIDRFILTLARREVVSQKPAFDFANALLVNEDDKVDVFAGVQFRAAQFLVLGAFYNYYLLHEISFGATVFF